MFLCGSYQKTKQQCFGNINVKDVNENKKFCKNFKLFFSSKGLNSNKLMLIEKKKQLYNNSFSLV